MPNVDHAPCSMFRKTSSKAAQGDMIEIVTDRSGLALLHERFGGTPAECRKRLGSIPGHRLFLAARPIRHAADDLKHFPKTSLSLYRPAALRPIEGLASKTGGLGQLAFRHPKAVRDLLDRDFPVTVHIGQDERFILHG